MRIFALTAGALALTAGIAHADPIVSPSSTTNYPAVGSTEGYAPMAQPDPQAEMAAPGAQAGFVEPNGRPADGFAYQNDTSARDGTPNMGAGTSRSSSANGG